MNKKMMLIRGARLLQALDEMTLIDLEQSIVSGFPATTKRQHATNVVRVNQLKIIPFDQTGNLQVDAVARGDGKNYDTKILFDQIEYLDEETPTSVTFMGSDRQEYTIEKIDLASSNVKLSCNCLDFHYRFAYWNKSNDVLLGTPPPPYRRKTNRPPVNPNKVPGVCKHLIKTVEALRQAGLVD